MAEPLHYEPPTIEEEKIESEVQLLLESLSDSGVLRILSNLLQTRHELLDLGLEKYREFGGVEATNNVLVLLKGLSYMDPDLLHEATGRVVEAGNKSLYESIVLGRTPSLWELIRQLGEDDTKRGLAVAVSVLKSLGREPAEERAQE